MGFGVAEGAIVLVILLVLFAPTLIAFWLGYTLGTKKSGQKPADGAGVAPDTASAENEAPPEEPADD